MEGNNTSQRKKMEQHLEEKRNKYAIACCIIASIISILMGYDTGVMSGAMLFIKKDLKIGDGQVEVLAGIINICALGGSLTAGRVSDWLGRRRTIAVGAAVFFVGSALMGAAPGFAALVAGRCVAGVGVGYALMIAPVYSAEVSAPATRGFLTSLPEMCISVGILLGYVANYLLAKLPLAYGWRAMLGLGALPSAALAVGIFAMPESPRWLVMQGRIKEAREVLLRVSNAPEEAELRLREIKSAAGISEASDDDDAVQLTKQPAGKGVWKELLLRPTPPRDPDPEQAADRHHGVGLTKTCFLLVATFLIDKVGRRPLLLTSLGGMALSLAGLGFGLTMVERSGERLGWAIALSIAAVFVFLAFFSIGLGPITWVYSSEIFPLRLRAQGASLGVAVNRLMNGIVSMTFISLYKAITIGGAFFLFAGIAVLAWLFFFLACPETRGRPLEEMEEVFSSRRRRRSTDGSKQFEIAKMEGDQESASS
uniref:Major facilitator superfamily (MFS) profile domain-containing protein n=1 Tax=Ananas comosus var. bracteatus TaxID=296719 RepID=A0A6V7PNQ0_ANACO|nr:unnamed protein product [Ananas comosus var. bracteatus]